MESPTSCGMQQTTDDNLDWTQHVLSTSGQKTESKDDHTNGFGSKVRPTSTADGLNKNTGSTHVASTGLLLFLGVLVLFQPALIYR